MIEWGVLVKLNNFENFLKSSFILLVQNRRWKFEMTINYKTILYHFSRLYILIWGLSFYFELLSVLYYGTLPYLNQHDFLVRFFYWAIVWLVGPLLFFYSAPKWHVKYFIYKDKTEYIKLALAFMLMHTLYVYFSSNIVSHLVEILPNKSFEQSFQVVSAKTQGSKRRDTRSLNLDLRIEGRNNFYNLDLAKRRFNYSKGQIQATDTVTLKGKQNFFGVLVESVEIFPSSNRSMSMPQFSTQLP